LIRENNTKIQAATIKSVEDVIKDAKTVITNDNAEEMKGAFERLQNVVHQMSSELYQKTSAGGQGQGGPQDGQEAKAEKKEGEQVIDAEFKDVN